jgi:DNA repair exonuclease SbcCD ATPase subunit
MSDKWTLYHQTGPDGQEWGVRVRRGYVVVGFSREDAEAVVAWQNAAVSRPAGGVLERAKALQEQLYDEPDESVGGNPCRYRKQLFDLIPELIAEVEASRNMVREFQNHEDQTHAEMEKIVGNSDNFIELTRQLKEEVERLRSAYLAYSQRHDRIFQKVIKRNKAQRIRIKELEAEKERLEAAFLESEAYAHACMGESMPVDGEDWQAAREALEKIRSGKDD